MIVPRTASFRKSRALFPFVPPLGSLTFLTKTSSACFGSLNFVDVIKLPVWFKTETNSVINLDNFTNMSIDHTHP